jgi:PIN domain nuclease of toxin-antitoxin system
LKLLLDTNAFLRLMGDRPLTRVAERVLNRSDTQRFVSIVTAWEIAIKHSLSVSATDVEAGIAAMPATLLPIKFQHLDQLSRLPLYTNHRDPFDRLLIAQAIAEDLSIVSSDMRFGNYKGLRVLWD